MKTNGTEFTLCRKRFFQESSVTESPYLLVWTVRETSCLPRPATPNRENETPAVPCHARHHMRYCQSVLAREQNFVASAAENKRSTRSIGSYEHASLGSRGMTLPEQNDTTST